MAFKCVIAGCTSKSSTFIQCGGDCGRSIHASCAGYSRNATSSSLPIWKNICDECFPDLATVTKMGALERELIRQGETLALTLSYVKKAVARMDLRDEHIDDLEKSMQQPSDSTVSRAVSAIDSKIDLLLSKSGESDNSRETIDLTPLMNKFDALASRVTQDVSNVARVLSSRIDTVEQLIDEIRMKSGKPSVDYSDSSCQSDPILTIATTSVVSLPSSVIVEDDSSDNSPVIVDDVDCQATNSGVPPLSLQDELDMQSTSICNWDDV